MMFFEEMRNTQRVHRNRSSNHTVGIHDFPRFALVSTVISLAAFTIAGTIGALPAAASIVSPTLSAQALVVGRTISAQVQVNGTQGLPGTLWWNLHGPESAGAGGGCGSASFSVSSTPNATVPVSGDGTYSVPPLVESIPGCYGYSFSLTGPYSSQVQIDPWSGGPKAAVNIIPKVAFNARAQAGQTVASVIIVGTANTHNSFSWSLKGPAARPTESSCADASYSGTALVAAGQFTVLGDATVDLPHVSLGTTPGCFSYRGVLSGSKLAQAVPVAMGRVDAVVSTYKATLEAVFVAPQTMTSWDSGSATDSDSAAWELAQMKSLKIGTVLLQNAAGVIDASAGGSDAISTAYPAPSTLATAPAGSIASFGSATVSRATAFSANLSEEVPSPDEVTTLLHAGDVTGVKVVIGLLDGRGLYDQPTSVTQTRCVISASCLPTAWMTRMVAYSEQVALEITPKLAGHASFDGWYLPMEFSSAGWSSLAAQSDLRYLYGSISSFLSALTPNKEVVIAPFLTLTAGSEALPATPNCPSGGALTAGSTSILAYNTPCALKGELSYILQGSTITTVLLQDGMGDTASSPYHPMSFAELPLWATAVEEATQQAELIRGTQIESGMIADLYPRPGSSSTFASVLANLAVYEDATGNATGFSWQSLSPKDTANQMNWSIYSSWVSS